MTQAVTKGSPPTQDASAPADGKRLLYEIVALVYCLRRRPRAYVSALLTLARETFGRLNFFVGGLAVFPKIVHAARQMEEMNDDSELRARLGRAGRATTLREYDLRRNAAALARIFAEVES